MQRQRTVAENGFVKTSQLILAGYMLVVPTPRPPGHEQVLPEKFLTISDCLMDDLPRPEFWDWYVDRDEAEHVRLSDAPHAETMAVAMNPDEARTFMEGQGGVDQPYFELLKMGRELPERSHVLGYEPVGAEETLDFHSWHCHGYAPEARSELDLRLNEQGMIGTYDEATRVLGWMLGQPPENQPAPVDWVVIALARP